MKMKAQHSNLWNAGKAVLRGKFSSKTILPQEIRKLSVLHIGLLLPSF